jgi:hypothetical protein
MLSQKLKALREQISTSLNLSYMQNSEAIYALYKWQPGMQLQRQ